MFDHSVNEQNVLLSDQMFADVHISSKTIKHDQTRCLNGKIFDRQTMFDRI